MGLSLSIGPTEECAEDRRNLLDDCPQTHTLGLECSVQRVVVIRLGSEHMIDQRQPTLAKPVGIRMSLVEPVAKKSLTLGRITPESSPVLQS